MIALALPDPILARARRAADAAGQTIEEYLTDLLGASLPGESGDGSANSPWEKRPPLRLTPEQLAGVRVAQAQIEAGEGIPVAKLRAERAAHREEWRNRPA